MNSDKPPAWAKHTVTFRRADGSLDDGVTVHGMLLMMLDGNPDEAAAPFRAILPRYKERARALLAAEQIKAAPRDPGDVLYDAFNGKALEDGIAAACDGDPHAFMRALEKAMAFTSDPVS